MKTFRLILWLTLVWFLFVIQFYPYHWSSVGRDWSLMRLRARSAGKSSLNHNHNLNLNNLSVPPLSNTRIIITKEARTHSLLPDCGRWVTHNLPLSAACVCCVWGTGGTCKCSRWNCSLRRWGSWRAGRRTSPCCYHRHRIPETQIEIYQH